MRQVHLVHHAGRGGDEVEVIFAGQPFLDDFQVQQAQESAAEAEAQCRAGFHLEAEAGVVQAQLEQAFAELVEVRRVDREQAAEHHRLDFLEARQRLGGGPLDVGDRVADRGLRDFLDLRGDEADFAGGELGQLLDLRGEAADPVDQMLRAGRHELDLLALLDDPVDDADQDDDAEIGVVPAVDQHRLQRRVAVALGRRDLVDHRLRALRRCRCPLFALVSTASLASSPITSSISARTFSGSAAGRSILLMTGTISWSCSID